MEQPTILLSFDIEEFDVPREHGVTVPLEEQVRISELGTQRILAILETEGVCATLFCTAQFAAMAPGVMERMVQQGHEVASHGYYHSRFEVEHLRSSREALEAQLGVRITGYRQARLMPLPLGAVREAGYLYNSSLNPTFIPGRYMHLGAPRRPFMEEGVLQIPVGVTPWLRIPLFWLSCHHFPFPIYRALCLRTLRHDGHLALYFHPWEFFPLATRPDLGLPYLIRHQSGDGMAQRLQGLIQSLKAAGAAFSTYHAFAMRQLRPADLSTPPSAHRP